MEKFKENITGEHANVHNVKGLDNFSFVHQMKDNKGAESNNEKGKKKPGHHLFREKVRFLYVLKKGEFNLNLTI